jgi:hypothetical protein
MKFTKWVMRFLVSSALALLLPAMAFPGIGENFEADGLHATLGSLDVISRWGVTTPSPGTTLQISASGSLAGLFPHRNAVRQLQRQPARTKKRPPKGAALFHIGTGL